MAGSFLHESFPHSLLTCKLCDLSNDPVFNLSFVNVFPQITGAGLEVDLLIAVVGTSPLKRKRRSRRKVVQSHQRNLHQDLEGMLKTKRKKKNHKKQRMEMIKKMKSQGECETCFLEWYTCLTKVMKLEAFGPSLKCGLRIQQ